MSAALNLARLTAFESGYFVLLVVVVGFLAWRIRKNAIIVFSSLTVILVSSGFLLRDSWENDGWASGVLGALICVLYVGEIDAGDFQTFQRNRRELLKNSGAPG